MLLTVTMTGSIFLTTVGRYTVSAIVVSSLLLFVNHHIVVVDAQEQCFQCVNNEAPLRTGADCDELVNQGNGLFNTDSYCKDLQLAGWQKTCCPNPPTNFCTMCADGSDFNPDGTVPTGQFVEPYTCFDYNYQKDASIAMFEDGTCDDTFLRRSGHYCDCPGQVQECWLCPDKQPPTKPQKKDGWLTKSDCRGNEYLFSLLYDNECEAFPMTTGIDLASFCGCGGLNETESEDESDQYTCSLCEDGGSVTNPDVVYDPIKDEFKKTCKQAEDFMRDFVRTPAACANPNLFGKAREVCECGGGSSDAPMTMTMTKFLWSSVAVSSVVVMMMPALFF